jgi:hypothetical protein
MMTEAVRTSETSVNFNETSRRYIPEGRHLQLYHKYKIIYPDGRHVAFALRISVTAAHV